MNRRPNLTIVAPNASPEEAAAVVAALEQFMRATAPVAAVENASAASAWQRAALVEGIDRGIDPGHAEPDPWLGPGSVA